MNQLDFWGRHAVITGGATVSFSTGAVFDLSGGRATY
jgi:hypothetical protein